MSKKSEKENLKSKRIQAQKQAEKAETATTETEEGTEVKKVEKVKKVKVRGKKYQSAKAKIDVTKLYDIDDAIKLVKETSTAKFDSSVELHMIIKKVGFSVNITLPHSFGKQKKIEVASEETLKKLAKGIIDFDVLLATVDMMPKLVAYARILGPKGMMPNPKTGTLIKKASDAKDFSTSSITIKTEKIAPVVHSVVGKVSMDDTAIRANIDTIINSLGKNQLVKAYISPTMGPSIKLAV